MPVLVRYEGRGRAGLSPARLREHAERMLAALDLAEAELSILLCDDVVMRRLQRRHRGLRKTTDVLSFEMPSAPGGAPKRLLGDVVISVPTARRQAKAAGRPTRDEATELLAHGLLHLLGFDHRTAPELRRMKARTDLLCAAARCASKKTRVKPKR
jgi:probable rRNA maturation factor